MAEFTDMNIVIEEVNLDIVVHLPGQRRKLMRYLTTSDCVDIALAAQHQVDHDLYMEMSRRLLGFHDFEEAFRAGKFETPEEATE